MPNKRYVFSAFFCNPITMLITAKAKDKPANINRWYSMLISKIPKKLRTQS